MCNSKIRWNEGRLGSNYTPAHESCVGLTALFSHNLDSARDGTREDGSSLVSAVDVQVPTCLLQLNENKTEVQFGCVIVGCVTVALC